jgi:hypothetical protein
MEGFTVYRVETVYGETFHVVADTFRLATDLARAYLAGVAGPTGSAAPDDIASIGRNEDIEEVVAWPGIDLAADANDA